MQYAPHSEVVILGENASPLPPYEVVEVFLSSSATTATSRLNDVVIVGGANVSAREVEEMLLEHADVREALVVGRTDLVLGQVVHAIVVPADPARPHKEAFLAEFGPHASVQRRWPGTDTRSPTPHATRDTRSRI
ncbi:AMP-binding enzyme [Nonomuraea lactucae]|uniref:AMP-binding enzyme n=1 Tax=Nonomuraea lactucae TaxID=2249762 RepID=UPI0023DD0730|nr:hypothetical protein [Nonomuraea lactucae]